MISVFFVSYSIFDVKTGAADFPLLSFCVKLASLQIVCITKANRARQGHFRSAFVFFYKLCKLIRFVLEFILKASAKGMPPVNLDGSFG